jgi:NinB protein
MKTSFLLPRMMPRDMVICRLVDCLEDLPADQGYRVEVYEHRATRSDKQNRTLWWIYDNILTLGGETMGGWTKEDLHEFFLCSFFGTEVRAMFGKKRQVPKRRSSRLSKIEFAELVDFIYRFMAQQGVVLPEPDPDYAEHMEEKAA